jgi:hypothetical protein
MGKQVELYSKTLVKINPGEVPRRIDLADLALRLGKLKPAEKDDEAVTLAQLLETITEGDFVQKETGTVLFKFYGSNSLGITTDNDGYAESWMYIDNSALQIGFANGCSIAFNPGIMEIRAANLISLSAPHISVNLSNYVDNAAAIAAGLASGDLYNTDGVVKIVI